MPKKSKKRKSRKNEAKDAKVTDIDAKKTEQQCSGENAKASTEDESDFEISHECLERLTHTYSGTYFEMDDVPSPRDYKMYSLASYNEKSKSVEELESSKWVELPLKSESVSPTINPNWNDWSIRTESAFASERPKSAEEIVTQKLLPEPPLRKVSSLPILLSKELTEGAKEVVFTQLTIKRRDYFLFLTNMAADISDKMEFIEIQRRTPDKRESHVNNRWKQNDSVDWFELHELWDKTEEDLRVFMSFSDSIYSDFDEDAEISITRYEFQCIIDEVKDLHEGIDILLKKCVNCFQKYSRFCKSLNESLFLKNVAAYRRYIKYFQNRLKTELDQFQVLKKFVDCR